MCDLAGIPIPKGLSGKSLKPILTDRLLKCLVIILLLNQVQGIKSMMDVINIRLLHAEIKKETLMDILSDPGEMSDKSTDPAYRAVKSHLRNLLMKDLNKITQNAPVIK